MATKGEVRRGVEKYLRSKFSDYNNSVGQFDRVIMGVLSVMGSTLLQPDDPKFDHHIGLETERMLKKYGPGTDYYNERFGKKGKDSAMEYDPIMCMMVPAKDEMFKKGDKYKNKNGAVIEIDYYDKNGDVQYRHNKQAQSATEKGLKHMLERNGYVKDQKTVDFSSSDAKAVFKYLDNDVERALVNYRKALNNCKTSADCERLESNIRNAVSDIVDEYLQIWNEVGGYAQKRKNEVVKLFNEITREAFKKYNELYGK